MAETKEMIALDLNDEVKMEKDDVSSIYMYLNDCCWFVNLFRKLNFDSKVLLALFINKL